MAEWKPGDVAWGADWRYGDAPDVGFAVVKKVQANGLMLAQPSIPAFRHRTRVDPGVAYRSERDALAALAVTLRGRAAEARRAMEREEQRVMYIEKRLGE